MDAIVTLVGIILWICVAVSLYYLSYLLFIRWQMRNPYVEGRAGYWQRETLKHVFNARTLRNFTTQYGLVITCERVDDLAFKAAQMLETPSQTALVGEYNEKVFLPFLQEQSSRLRLRWRRSVVEHKISHHFDTALSKVHTEDGATYFRDLKREEINKHLEQRSLTSCGCVVKFSEFEHWKVPDEIIERNYTMLTDEHKEDAEEHEYYKELDEIYAVAALKRRLEFFKDHKKQTFDSTYVTIETETAGRGLNIKWRIKGGVLNGYDLIGMRKTDGFFPNQWDDQNNGPWVIQSSKDGEATEFLPEGQTYFYTFILKPWKSELTFSECPTFTSRMNWLFSAESRVRLTYAIARFQVTIETKRETDAIEATLRRFLERMKPDPDKERVSSALKDLDLIFELDTTLEGKTKAWEKKIWSNQDYSAEQKSDKIDRLRDAMASLRSKYEP